MCETVLYQKKKAFGFLILYLLILGQLNSQGCKGQS